MLIKNKNKSIIFFSILLFLLCLIVFATSMIMPFLLGCVLAYLLLPLVRYWDRKYSNRRRVHVSIAIILSTIVFIIVMMVVVPPLYDSLANIYRIMTKVNIQEVRYTIIEKIRLCLSIENLEVLDSLIITITNELLNLSKNILGHILLASPRALIDIIITVLLSPIVAYYLLCDNEKIKTVFFFILPSEYHKSIAIWGRNTNEILIRFVSGQFLISLIWSVYYGFSLFCIGVSSFIAIAVISFIVTFIPYIGAIIIFVFSLTITILEFGGITSETWYVVAIYIVGNIVDMAWVSNYIMSKKLGLHPLLTLFSLMFSAHFLGILGMFLAMPVTVLIKMIIMSASAKKRSNS